ncbi:MAG: HEAT repeat domain-containing protein [Gammaproteobacteria bacterium]|nr:HEAT repeat domain-containing protein [Gammaproteobacteria bacterium]
MKSKLAKSTALGLILSFASVAIQLAVAAPLSHAAQDALVHDAVRVAKTMLTSSDVYDRILAAGALAETGDVEALDVLKRYLANTDLVLKRSAIDTLMSSSHPSEVDLLYRTASADPEILGLMVESLAATPRPDMQDLLGDALQLDSLYVQKNALQAIARCKVGDFNAILNKMIGDPAVTATIKAYAYHALAQNGESVAVGNRLMAIAESGNVEEREVAAIALGVLEGEASKAVLGKLIKEDDDQRVILAALASHAGLGDDESIGRLIHGIAYGKAMESTILAGSLKRIPAVRAAQITEVLLSCCNLNTDAATRLLESWGSISSNPDKLYAWGLAHEDADVRLQTVWLVGQRKDLGALSNISALLKDEVPAIRTMAAWSIIHAAASGYVGGTET